MVSDPLLVGPGIKMPGHPDARMIHGEVFWKCIAEQDPVSLSQARVRVYSPVLICRFHFLSFLTTMVVTAHPHPPPITQQSDRPKAPLYPPEMAAAYPGTRFIRQRRLAEDHKSGCVEYAELYESVEG
jgi:hypothetical protein